MCFSAFQGSAPGSLPPLKLLAPKISAALFPEHRAWHLSDSNEDFAKRASSNKPLFPWALRKRRVETNPSAASEFSGSTHQRKLPAFPLEALSLGMACIDSIVFSASF